jgi:IstB-like ATP binding protein
MRSWRAGCSGTGTSGSEGGGEETGSRKAETAPRRRPYTSRCPTAPPSSSSRSLSERHERGSLVVTTNLPFGEWTKVFPDPRLAKAVVDRLTHRAHIIDTGNESWRFRHGLTRTTKKGGRPPTT